jgi:hypothetical protein
MAQLRRTHKRTLYQPALRPDQIAALYRLKVATGRPMTHLVRESVDEFLRKEHAKYETPRDA